MQGKLSINIIDYLDFTWKPPLRLPVKLKVPIGMTPIRGDDDYYAVMAYCLGDRERDKSTGKKKGTTPKIELNDPSLSVQYQLYVLNIPLASTIVKDGTARTIKERSLTETEYKIFREDLIKAFKKKYGNVKYVLYYVKR